MSIHVAAAPESSQVFALVGVLVMVPIILAYTAYAYTAYAYWVFRGKIDPDAGYH